MLPKASLFFLLTVAVWLGAAVLAVKAINRESILWSWMSVAIGLWVFGAIIFLGVFVHASSSPSS